MKQNKKSTFFKTLILMLFGSFLYTLDWGGGFILSKIPAGFSKEKNLELKGNPLKGFSLSGSISFKDVEFVFKDPVSISSSFFRVPESITVSNCLIKTGADSFELKMPTALFIFPKLIMSNTCKIHVELNDKLKNQLQVDYLDAKVSGQWDMTGEDGYLEIQLDSKEGIKAWFENSHATGIKAEIGKKSKWWGIFGFYPGPGDVIVDWERGAGDFILDDLTFSQIQDLRIIGSIYQDGDWSAIIPLEPSGVIGLKSDNKNLAGNWEGVQWRDFFNGLGSFLNIFLGDSGEFSLEDKILTLVPDEGEYFHEIQIKERMSGFLANKNTNFFENLSWDIDEKEILNVNFQDFSWLLPKPANWWPRGVFNGFLNIDSYGGIEGQVQISGPADIHLMNANSELDLFEISFKETQKGFYGGDSFLLRLSDPALVLFSESFSFSEEKGILAKGKVATTSESIVKFFGKDVIGLISLFAGPEHQSQIFQIPVEISGTTKDPKISMAGMPLRWELCPTLDMMDCLEKRAKQNPN